METNRPLPFDCEILDKEPVKVKNPYSGESCMLEPDAVAVHDVIKGAELLEDYVTMNQGLQWFRMYFPNEFYILFD